jgi:hypothetical protein
VETIWPEVDCNAGGDDGATGIARGIFCAPGAGCAAEFTTLFAEGVIAATAPCDATIHFCSNEAGAAVCWLFTLCGTGKEDAGTV